MAFAKAKSIAQAVAALHQQSPVGMVQLECRYAYIKPMRRIEAGCLDVRDVV